MSGTGRRPRRFHACRFTAKARHSAGFSSGGGFAVRFAGSNQQQLFQSYLMLAPFLSQDAPTMRPDAGGWASVGLPRIIAIAILMDSVSGLSIPFRSSASP